MQTKKLRHYEKQEKRPRQAGKKQTLQVLPQTYLAQRNKIIKNAEIIMQNAEINGG